MDEKQLSDTRKTALTAARQLMEQVISEGKNVPDWIKHDLKKYENEFDGRRREMYRAFGILLIAVPCAVWYGAAVHWLGWFVSTLTCVTIGCLLLGSYLLDKGKP